jgi:hypothetical protein
MRHLEKNISGELNTWAIKWQASVILNEGLCLHPRTSLVANMGADGSGTHMKAEEADRINAELAVRIPKEFPVALAEDQEARRRIGAFYAAERERLTLPASSLFQRIKGKVKRIFA